MRAACDLGASYLGFNFAASSPRRVTRQDAARLRHSGRGALRVGVFVGETPEEIVQAADTARLDLVQLHRPLQEADLALPLPIIAVVTVGEEDPELPAAALLSRCHAVLFDSADRQRAGSRDRFDWSGRRPPASPVPVFLAGGLTPENVAAAIRLFRPAVVDVASGVEAAPGIKDPDRMRGFFRAVADADAG